MAILINGGKPVELLLVEDKAEDAELTIETLREGRIRNLRVHWVEDGEQAMAFLRREGKYADAPRPDLILLDLEMPRMNGLEVLAAVKQDPAFRRIPVVMMTSSSRDEHVHTAYNRHANCYVTKPIDFDEFIEAVRSIEEFWLNVVRLPAA
jgi:two-component system, chemotaxis family, response regulator Rcp1